MANTGDRPEQPVLKRNGFELSRDRFTVTDIERVEGSRLRELFNPESLRLKRDQKRATEEAHRLFKKAFFAAQLRHYGVKFPSSHTMPKLRDLLEVSVRQGLCDRLPESVIQLQQEMRRDYALLCQKWESEARAWDASKKKRDDAAYAKLATPGQRAEFDLNRFMNQYFLTDGKPDPSKTPEPLALQGLRDRWRVHNLAERTFRDLHTCSGGRDENRTVCIGWDRASVFALASKLDAQGRKAQKKRAEDEWGKAMEAHERYVSAQSSAGSSRNDNKKKGKATAAEATKRQPFDIERARGSYVLQCKAVTDEFDVDPRHGLTLDISVGIDGLLIASYDLGPIEGSMFLSLSEEKLDSLAERMSDSASEDDNDDEDNYHSLDSDSDDERQKKGPKSSKGKTTTTTTTSKKRPAKSTSSKQPAKKKRAAPSVSRRTHYILRGRETGEGEILPTVQSGHIDFLDDECTKFEGLAHQLPFIGDNVKFQGYKVSDTPRRRPEPWSAFSASAYEHARTSRWH